MKRRLHFYQAFSRIGLQNPPNYSTIPNLGVEEAPQTILTSSFLSNYTYQIDQFHFSAPESISSKSFYPQLATEIQSFRHLINHSMKPHQKQVVIGGDHSVTLPSVLAALDRLKDDRQLLYIQIDSHGDCNLRAHSPSDNFHGMYLRPLFARDFDIPEINQIVDHQLRAPHILYFGNLDLDGDEPDFFKRQKIKNFSSADLINPDAVIKFLTKITQKVSHIHISFDIDSLDHAIAPATGIPANKGLTITQISPVLEFLSKFPSISLDLVEFNPRLPGAKETQKTIHTLLKILL